MSDLPKTKDDLVDLLENAQEVGRRVMARSIIGQLLPEIGGDQREYARLVMELEDTRRVLRGLCADHGDNDWPDDLHLADALDKHLGDHLNERSSYTAPWGEPVAFIGLLAATLGAMAASRYWGFG